jgi:hypothetical protein
VALTNTTRRLIAVAAFAVAAVAGPSFAAMTTTAGSADHLAECLAWFGNKEDGHCLSYSNGKPIVGNSPGYNYCSPGNRNNNKNCGASTGPLLPGTTINQGIG